MKIRTATNCPEYGTGSDGYRYGRTDLFESLKNVLKRGLYQEFSATTEHVVLVILISTFYLFYMKNAQDYSRLAMLYLGFLYLGISYTVRLFWKHRIRQNMQNGGKRSLLIVTTESMLDKGGFQHLKL